MRRAGFCYRATFERFVRRYKKLSPKTWGLWGEWQGDMKEGTTIIVNEMQLESGQWQMGATKVFIRHPETLFHLEESLEKKDYEAIVRIQKAFRGWKAKRHALEQRAAASDLLKGKKERKRGSVEYKFTADYINWENNAGITQVMAEFSMCIFFYIFFWFQTFRLFVSKRASPNNSPYSSIKFFNSNLERWKNRSVFFCVL